MKRESTKERLSTSDTEEEVISQSLLESSTLVEIKYVKMTNISSRLKWHKSAREGPSPILSSANWSPVAKLTPIRALDLKFEFYRHRK